MTWYDYQLTFEFESKLTEEQANKIALIFQDIYFTDATDMCPQGQSFIAAKVHSVCAPSSTNWRELCVKMGRLGVRGNFYVVQETEGTCGTVLCPPIVWSFGPKVVDPEEEQSRIDEQEQQIRAKAAFVQFQNVYTAMINLYESKNPQECDWNAIADLLRLDLRGTARIDFYTHCVAYFTHAAKRENT